MVWTVVAGHVLIGHVRFAGLDGAQGKDGNRAPGVVIGGALGNALDRVRQGAVTDFLDAHYAGWHWPAFNLADVAVVGGVGIYVAAELFGQRHTVPHRPSVPPRTSHRP